MNTKLWINDKLHLVDVEVAEYIEQLNVENERRKRIIEGVCPTPSIIKAMEKEDDDKSKALAFAVAEIERLKTEVQAIHEAADTVELLMAENRKLKRKLCGGGSAG